MTFDNLRNQTAAVGAFPVKKKKSEMNSLRSLLSSHSVQPKDKRTLQITPSSSLPFFSLLNENFLLALP